MQLGVRKLVQWANDPLGMKGIKGARDSAESPWCNAGLYFPAGQKKGSSPIIVGFPKILGKDPGRRSESKWRF
jgi:hypothetical protein